MTISDLKKINNYLFEIPKTYRKKMRVSACIYAKRNMLDDIFGDRTIEQLINVSTLPGIQGAALAMPDAHEGYGFPIGGVAAVSYPEGVVSPGGIGYDINCGVRLLMSEIDFKAGQKYITKLADEFAQVIPSGLGRGGSFKLDQHNLDKVLTLGVEALIQKGYGREEDLERIESGGRLKVADPTKVSDWAKQRGYDQLGTLGAGNHFIEIDQVEQIFNQSVAEIFGLFKDQLVVLIHTGSRGIGHQIASDYIKLMNRTAPQYGIKIFDPELICAPINSKEGLNYLKAMACGANFAWANRQIITYQIRQVWKKNIGSKQSKLDILYDVAHNIAKIEEHKIHNDLHKLLIHRKGATRAFPSKHQQIPKKYQSTGQPVIIPGSMGTASYVLHGTVTAMEQTFGTVCHGAGRIMSRASAKQQINVNQLIRELSKQGIYVKASFPRTLAEEAPSAYKNVADVIEVIDKTGLAKKVAKLKPIAVVKG